MTVPQQQISTEPVVNMQCKNIFKNYLKLFFLFERFQGESLDMTLLMTQVIALVRP